MTDRVVNVGRPGGSYYVELDENELAAIILEVLVGKPRPKGVSANALVKRTIEREPQLGNAALMSARAALNYMAERFKGASEVQ